MYKTQYCDYPETNMLTTEEYAQLVAMVGEYDARTINASIVIGDQEGQRAEQEVRFMIAPDEMFISDTTSEEHEEEYEESDDEIEVDANDNTHYSLWIGDEEYVVWNNLNVYRGNVQVATIDDRDNIYWF